jgi:hypothetical protein
MQWIAAGQFTEIGGPGGRPIGVVSAARNPAHFWLVVAWFPLGGAILSGFFLRPLIRRRRLRSCALCRLQNQRNGAEKRRGRRISGEIEPGLFHSAHP